MGPLPDDDFVTRPGLTSYGELVTHRTAGDEEGRLLSCDRGRLFLERQNGWILAEHIVTYLGLGHGGAHARRGARDGIASEIEHGDKVDDPRGPRWTVAVRAGV